MCSLDVKQTVCSKDMHFQCPPIGRSRGGLRGGQPQTTSDKGWGVTDFSVERARGSLFLSWEKEFFEDSSVKRSIVKPLMTQDRPENPIN
jgi:hypothetical protein